MATNLPMADDNIPALDVRVVPHKIRHATVIGAISAIQGGHSIDLIAPHDPQPLLRQIEGLEPGVWSVEYLERGPEAWTLRLTRSGV